MDPAQWEAITKLIQVEIQKQLGVSAPAPAPATSPAPVVQFVQADSKALEGTAGAVAESLKHHLKFSTDMAPCRFSQEKAFRTTAAAVKERMMEKWNKTYDHFCKEDPKQAHYLSMEYLLGRLLRNAVGALGLQDEFGEALKQMGWDMEEFETSEFDAGLGNGGLGRLAACYMDSLATLDLPAWGYAVRYRFGLFRQVLRNGTSD